MKKITFLSVAVAMASQLNGQFIQMVNHAGALSSDASQDWTKGWAEWNPKQASYGIATETTTLNDASGIKNITGTVTLDASKVYLLTSTCVVRSGGKLIIPAGTVIRGAADLTATPKLYATLVVERGGMIEVNGTSSNPVVMTSNKAAGSRDRGDWGGLVLCGKAVNNQSVDAQLEGFNNVAVDNTLGKFGGTDDADNSGVIKYVRIEFAGLAFEPNKEVNSLTMGSVGSKTEIEGVQCSFGNDDGFEWFGGTVNCKKLISFKTTDDDFDTDFGYRGAVQFGIAVRDTAYFDLSWNAPSGASTSETFESDNDAAGSGKLPLTSAIFSNITCVGPVPLDKTYNDLTTTQKGAFRRGARIRRNSRLSIVNSVFMGYRNFIMFDGDSVLIASGVKSSTFSETSNVLRNNFIANTSAAAAAGATNTGLVEVDSKNTPAAMDAWLRDAKNSNKIDDVNYASGAILVDPKNATAPDFRPVVASKINTLANYDAAIFTKFGKFSSVNTVGNLVVTNAYPVPATDVVNVELYSVAGADVTVVIADISGKTVKSLGTQTLVAGGNLVTASVSDLNNGLYFLNVVSNGAKTTYRFTVAK
ncbi:MAG: T9SS type A sorting domain-containing protein [Bacteroidia bacterium]